MRNTTILLFVLISYGTNAQFSIQPQIGLENSRTSIKSDGFSSFSPMGMQLDPRLAALWDISSKPAMVYLWVWPPAARE